MFQAQAGRKLCSNGGQAQDNSYGNGAAAPIDEALDNSDVESVTSSVAALEAEDLVRSYLCVPLSQPCNVFLGLRLGR